MRIINHSSAYITAILLSAIVFYRAGAQMVIHSDSTRNQLSLLLESKAPADRQELNRRLQLLAASNTETDMAIAASFYYQLKNTKAFDSLCTAQVNKFPKGLEARIKTQQAISGINNLPEMEKAYKAFIKKFPPNNYQKLPLGQDRLPYDRLRSSLANGYAKEKKVVKANYYAGLLEADFWKVRAYSDLSDIFYANGDIAHATLYQKKAVESARPYAEGKMGNSAAAGFAAKSYAEECNTYAHILYEQKNYSEALKYIEIAIQSVKEPRPAVNYTYAKILAALHRNREAYDNIEAVIKSGKATGEMAGLFKALYITVKGSDAGLNAYEADIHNGVMNDLKARLTKMMVNEPAANFTLTDLHGNQVNLADLRGKVVVLDFWATWCRPCKASFPAMQMAVNKYKSDSGINFLFIHTWERTTTPVEDATTYIEGMKYSFQVLMDTKDPETKANKVVDSYNVTGIPAKFVIDEKGNIRFKLTGFDGSNEAAVDELSMMIDMVKTKS